MYSTVSTILDGLLSGSSQVRSYLATSDLSQLVIYDIQTCTNIFVSSGMEAYLDSRNKAASGLRKFLVHVQEYRQY